MAEISANHIVAAARALMLAGRWSQAAELLASARPADDAERALLAVTAAEVAVDQDFWIRTDVGSPALASAATVADEAVVYDLEFVQLKHDYDVQLFAGSSFGPGGRDPVVLEQLAARAAALLDRSPELGRQARTAFYAGLIADNLRGDAIAGRAFFEQARQAGEQAGDDLIVSYALRHLAFGMAQSGDLAQAKPMLERSMELRQRIGCVPHVLAQQLALAELARDAGDDAWCRAIAGHVHTWARGLEGRTWLIPAAEELMGDAQPPGDSGP